jgi:hypothetical protein
MNRMGAPCSLWLQSWFVENSLLGSPVVAKVAQETGKSPAQVRRTGTHAGTFVHAHLAGDLGSDSAACRQHRHGITVGLSGWQGCGGQGVDTSSVRAVLRLWAGVAHLYL